MCLLSFQGMETAHGAMDIVLVPEVLSAKYPSLNLWDQKRSVIVLGHYCLLFFFNLGEKGMTEKESMHFFFFFLCWWWCYLFLCAQSPLFFRISCRSNLVWRVLLTSHLFESTEASLSLAVQGPANYSCEDDTWLLYGNQCFNLNQFDTSWDLAQQGCLGLNAHLATVSDTGIQSFLGCEFIILLLTCHGRMFHICRLNNLS